MTRYPACYIRESSGEALNDREKEGQRIDCRTMAERDGLPADRLVEYDDWGRSGAGMKPAQQRMIEDIRAGRVEVVYARSMDRLTREGAKATLDFLQVAEKHGTRIVTQREGELSASVLDADPSRWLGFSTLAQFAEYESRVGKARAAKAMATKRRNGQRLGQPPYGTRPGEDAGAVVAAFREAGSYLGAARILATQGFKSRFSHRPSVRDGGGGMQGWSASTVKRIIQREAPELVPVANRAKGSRTRSAHFFSRLLICPHDGCVLTTMPRRDASTAYICREGHRAPKGTHPRPWTIAETGVLAWAKRALASQFEIRKVVERDSGFVADVTALEERKRRIVRAFTDGNLSDADYSAGIAAVDAELVRLQAAERASVTWRLGLDWTLPEAEVNSRLRDLWLGIRMEYVPMERPRKGVHTRAFDLVPVAPIWRTPPEEVNPDAEAELRDPEAAGLTVEPY
jgi:DNA invertase Pin-like site-specific DNA recombinase